MSTSAVTAEQGLEAIRTEANRQLARFEELGGLKACDEEDLAQAALVGLHRLLPTRVPSPGDAANEQQQVVAELVRLQGEAYAAWTGRVPARILPRWLTDALPSEL